MFRPYTILATFTVRTSLALSLVRSTARASWGIAPKVKVMALKFLGPRGGLTSDAIRAIQYATKMGAKISNNSWGGGIYSQALKDAIDASGMLFVAAAGNGGSHGIGDDNEATSFYPASYASPNILSVAAINN
jgi:hypothetical protein